MGVLTTLPSVLLPARNIALCSPFITRLSWFSIVWIIHSTVHHAPRAFNHRKPEDFISLRQLAKNQTVLLAREGAEDGLSAPTSFESLRSQPLLLDRSGIIAQDIDIVKVSLATAVRFFIDLEIREDLAGRKNEEPSRDTSLGLPVGAQPPLDPGGQVIKSRAEAEGNKEANNSEDHRALSALSICQIKVSEGVEALEGKSGRSIERSRQ